MQEKENWGKQSAWWRMFLVKRAMPCQEATKQCEVRMIVLRGWTEAEFHISLSSNWKAIQKKYPIKKSTILFLMIQLVLKISERSTRINKLVLTCYCNIFFSLGRFPFYVRLCCHVPKSQKWDWGEHLVTVKVSVITPISQAFQLREVLLYLINPCCHLTGRTSFSGTDSLIFFANIFWHRLLYNWKLFIIFFKVQPKIII